MDLLLTLFANTVMPCRSGPAGPAGPRSPCRLEAIPVPGLPVAAGSVAEAAVETARRQDRQDRGVDHGGAEAEPAGPAPRRASHDAGILMAVILCGPDGTSHSLFAQMAFTAQPLVH